MEQAKPAAVASNKKVVLWEYISRAPREDNMVLVDGDTVALCVPEGAAGPAVLVKNLYLSCDPYMRGRMQDFHGYYIPPFKPRSVIEGFGVARVLDSTHPGFGVGDIVSGLTGWEEYSLIDKPEQLRKIQQSDIPLSYHLGLLGDQLAIGKETGCHLGMGTNMYLSSALLRQNNDEFMLDVS